MPFEVLDWGEVWAMQAFMRGIMPLHDTPGGQYYSAYWSLSDPSTLGQIARRKDAGAHLSAEGEADVQTLRRAG